MFPYSRLYVIFNYINNNEFTSIGSLSSVLNVTGRTIRSDINTINNTLSRKGASISLKRGIGYYLVVEDETLYNQFIKEITQGKESNLELDSSEDRLKYLLSILLYNKNYISLDELANKVYISKATLQNYIKSLKTILNKYNLDYISKINLGVRIIGNEEDIRKCLIDNVLIHNFQNYLVGFTKDEYALFEFIDLDLVKDIVISSLSSHNIKTNDFNLKNIIIHVALMISRVKNDCYINIKNKQLNMPNNVFELVEELSKLIENNFDIDISVGEKQYLYLHILSNTDVNYDTDIKDQFIRQNIDNLLNIVNQNYNFDLKNDEILKNDLFNHFRSILTNKFYAINKRNPLLNTIKTNFPLAYEITLTATTQVFNKEPYKLNDDEVGYVSLHIGAAIERCFSGTLQKKNVILVCGSGQATTRMLEARLNIFFNNKISIVRKASYNEYTNYSSRELKNVDFVISTIPLKKGIIPSITVDFSLKNNDIEAISKFIVSISKDKERKTSRFFDKNLFIKMPTIKNKEQVIKTLCASLEANNYIDSNFYNSVMLRESLAHTNMNEVFALPHPMDLCARETKVSVLILDKPVLWNGKESVQIIFLLAIKKGDQKYIEHLYDIFIEIVNNPKLQQEIIHSDSFDTFLHSINKCIE